MDRIRYIGPGEVKTDAGHVLTFGDEAEMSSADIDALLAREPGNWARVETVESPEGAEG